MTKLFCKAISILLVTLLNVFALNAHSSALSSVSTHSMKSMKHTSTSLNCAMLCSAAVTYKEDELSTVDEEKDDKSSEPFYAQFQFSVAFLSEKHTTLAKHSVLFEPPPGLPAYIQFSVFRT